MEDVSRAYEILNMYNWPLVLKDDVAGGWLHIQENILQVLYKIIII